MFFPLQNFSLFLSRNMATLQNLYPGIHVRLHCNANEKSNLWKKRVKKSYVTKSITQISHGQASNRIRMRSGTRLGSLPLPIVILPVKHRKRYLLTVFIGQNFFL